MRKDAVFQVLTHINGKRLSVGERVLVRGRGNDIIKFIGPTYFGPHLWYGIRLDKKLGRSDGMVQSYRYFECPVKAAQAGYDKIVELLIKYGSDIDATTEDGTTALFNAVEKGHIKVVQVLVENNLCLCIHISPIYPTQNRT